MDKVLARKLYVALSGDKASADEAAGTIACMVMFGDVSDRFRDTIEAAILDKAGKPIVFLDESTQEWTNAVDRDLNPILYPTVTEWYGRPRGYSYIVNAARRALVSEVRA